MRIDSRTGWCGRRSGFTRLDVAAALAALLVVAGLTLPVVGQSRMAGAGIGCQGNLRELARGWLMYAADYGDRLVRSGGMDSLVQEVNASGDYPLNQWCMGTVHQVPGATNSALIRDSLLFPYVRSLPAYRCPADRSTTGSSAFVSHPDRVRSMAMNGLMNPINAWANDNSAGSRPFTNFRRLGSIISPDRTWVFLDENPATINDGWFICDPGEQRWIDAPSSLHQNAGCLAFADGHVELKRWTDSSILGRGASIGAPPWDFGADLRWLQSRTTHGSGGFIELP